MTANVMNLSPSKLKDLKSGEAINVRYATSQNAIDSGASYIVFEQFPKRIATAFSSTWAELFPAINKVKIQDLSRPKRTSVTVIGGDIDVIRSILLWMISCCEGQGMTPFPLYSTKPFYNYLIVKESADNMGIAVLSQEMERRLKNLASRQIHSEDVRALYLNLPADHPILKDVAAHIADLIWTHKLRAYSAYKTVREEIPIFDADVNAALAESSEAYRAARMLSSMNILTQGKSVSQGQKESQKAQQVNQSTKTVKARASYSRSLVKSQSSVTHPNDEKPRGDPQIQHTTIRCPIAHKAKKGRPAYVKLSLADAGVNKDEFTGEAFLSPMVRKPRRKSQALASKAQGKGIDTPEGKKEASDQHTTSALSAADPDNKKDNSVEDSNKVSQTCALSPTSSCLATPILTSASISTASSLSTSTTVADFIPDSLSGNKQENM